MSDPGPAVEMRIDVATGELVPVPQAVLVDLPADIEREQDLPELPVKWELKELKPLHKQVASLIAQGFKRKQIAAMVNITPQYVTMLIAQPLVKQYIEQMCAIAETQVSALFPKSVDVLSDVLTSGSEKGKLVAVRTVLEVTKRIGSKSEVVRDPVDQNARLEDLSKKLIDLQASVRNRGASRVDTNEDIIDV